MQPLKRTLALVMPSPAENDIVTVLSQYQVENKRNLH